MGIVEEYLSHTKTLINEYGEKSVVLMQVGSFFEIYALLEKNNTYSGSKIKDVASICEMVIVNKSLCVSEGKQVSMAGFGLAQIDKYIKKLQNKGYTIAVYTQDTPTKNTTRSLAEIISPGTFFGNDTDELSNNITCIWIHKTNSSKFLSESITIGVSNVDIYTGKTSIAQFDAEGLHNPCTYDDLERYVAVYCPRECIVVTNLSEHKIQDIISFIGLDTSTVHLVTSESKNSLGQFAINAEKQTYQLDVFIKFYPTHEDLFHACYSNNYIAVQSLILLLDFVYQHSPYLISKLTVPIFDNHTSRLVLANHSLKQLNILDDTRHTGKCRSILSLLNNCVTAMGKRQFVYLFTNPTTDIHYLNKTYEITNTLLQTRCWEDYRSNLSNVSDIEKLCRKIVMKRASPKDLAILIKDIKLAAKLYNIVKQRPELEYFQSLDITNIDLISNEIIHIVENIFDLDKCLRIDDLSPDKLILVEVENTGFIHTGKYETIDNLRSLSIDGRSKLEVIAKYMSNNIQKLEKSKKTTQFIKIHETPKSDPVLQGTKRRIELFKKTVKDCQEVNLSYICCVRDNQVTFPFSLSDMNYRNIGNNKTLLSPTNPLIDSICSGLQKSKDKLVQELIKVYTQFINDFMEHIPKIENIITFLTQLDIEQCRCYIADKYNYCKPEIIPADKSFFEVENLRHPLIEHLQTRELYVTNDLKMGRDKDGLLLYGTNAVGKTSFIKSVGIAIIMAQSGFYTPCSKLCYYPYNYIFTRILGNDNIFKGLSTFAVEMSELRTILKQANQNSLVLGDELCSGTESDSALSIFTAGLEVLHNIKSTFLFATHFHEVAGYEEIKELDRLKMMHMEVIYDAQTDNLIYDRKLKDGPGDSMYGLEVCKSLSLPKEFLQRAHDIRMKYNPKKTNPLAQKPSHFNVKQIGGICEICKNEVATEVHHLEHQHKAQENNKYIGSFHKNHTGNLINICDTCHKDIHKNNSHHRKTKTSDGYKILLVK